MLVWIFTIIDVSQAQFISPCYDSVPKDRIRLEKVNNHLAILNDKFVLQNGKSNFVKNKFNSYGISLLTNRESKFCFDFYFTSPSTTNSLSTIWAMNIENSFRQQLFDDKYERKALTVSDDGSRIAYAKRLNPVFCENGYSLWICTAKIDGSNEKEHFLLPNYADYNIRYLDFNGDNSQILFATYECDNRNGDIFRLDIASGNVIALTNDNDYVKQWVRYGKSYSKITFSKVITGWFAYPIPGQIMNIDGSNLITFDPFNGGNYHGLQYSPDGTKLLFSHVPVLRDPFTLFITDENGNNPKSIYVSDSDFKQTYNPEGNKIALVEGTTLKIIDTIGNL